MPEFNEIVEIARKVCKSEVKTDEDATPKAILIDPSDLLAVCKHLHENSATYFDMLSCVTGIDNGPEVGMMEIAYNLYSIPFDHHLMIKVALDRSNPSVDSLTSIWKGADWLERETFDMYGIQFRDHPDPRRILNPADWEGYPLRKDYKHQDTYRGIKVEY
jgi:NADH-quinone oxidoreductase subunit C